MTDEFYDNVGRERVEVDILNRHDNTMIVDMYVPLQRPVEFITLNFTVVDGVAFQEADRAAPIPTDEEEFFDQLGSNVRIGNGLGDMGKIVQVCHLTCIGSLSCKYKD